MPATRGCRAAYLYDTEMPTVSTVDKFAVVAIASSAGGSAR